MIPPSPTQSADAIIETAATRFLELRRRYSTPEEREEADYEAWLERERQRPPTPDETKVRAHLAVLDNSPFLEEPAIPRDVEAGLREEAAPTPDPDPLLALLTPPPAFQREESIRVEWKDVLAGHRSLPEAPPKISFPERELRLPEEALSRSTAPRAAEENPRPRLTMASLFSGRMSRGETTDALHRPPDQGVGLIQFNKDDVFYWHRPQDRVLADGGTMSFDGHFVWSNRETFPNAAENHSADPTRPIYRADTAIDFHNVPTGLGSADTTRLTLDPQEKPFYSFRRGDEEAGRFLVGNGYTTIIPLDRERAIALGPEDLKKVMREAGVGWAQGDYGNAVAHLKNSKVRR